MERFYNLFIFSQMREDREREKERGREIEVLLDSSVLFFHWVSFNMKMECWYSSATKLATFIIVIDTSVILSVFSHFCYKNFSVYKRYTIYENDCGEGKRGEEENGFNDDKRMEHVIFVRNHRVAVVARSSLRQSPSLYLCLFFSRIRVRALFLEYPLSRLIFLPHPVPVPSPK